MAKYASVLFKSLFASLGLITIVEQVFQIESASDKDRKYIIKLNTNTTEVSTNHVYTGERAEKPQGVSHNLYKFRHWRHRLPTTNRLLPLKLQDDFFIAPPFTVVSIKVNLGCILDTVPA